MDLWYERLELAEEHRKELLRDAHSWELLQEALKSSGKLVHPAAQLFNQLNQRAMQTRADETAPDAPSTKDKRHVDQLA